MAVNVVQEDIAKTVFKNLQRMNDAHIYLHARLDIDRNRAIRIGRASQFVLLVVEV